MIYLLILSIALNVVLAVWYADSMGRRRFLEDLLKIEQEYTNNIIDGLMKHAGFSMNEINEMGAEGEEARS